MLDAVPTLRARRELWFFLAFALVILAAGIGLRDPWPSDEPRFTLAAKQMIESGDWLFPHRGRELYSDKPPMLFWLEAASYELTRSWRVAFLLPSLLAALGTLWLTYDLGRRFWNHRAGLYAAIAVLFAFQFMYQMKRAQIDPLVTGWITLANWGLLVHFVRGPNWRAFWIGCFAAGLGVITKGVGILAFLMFAPYLFARMRRWDGVTVTSGSALRWAVGGVAFLIPILVWGLTVLAVARSRAEPEYTAYVNDLFFHQTADRYAKSWTHVQPWWYFLPIILFNWFPISLFFGASASRWWRDLNRGEARVMLPLVWTIMTIVFFSIPVGKRDVYIIPCIPMLAVSMASYFEEIVATRWMRHLAFAITLGVGLFVTGAGVWMMQGHSAAFEDLLRRRELEDIAHAVWGMVLVIGAGFLAAAALFQPRRGVHALLAGITVLWLVWSFWAYPLLNDSSSSAGVMRHAREFAGNGTEIGMVAWKEQNLLMAQGPVQDFGFVAPWRQQYDEAVRWLAERPAQRRVFILDEAMGVCVDRSKAIRVGEANRREWWLFGQDAVVPGCSPIPKNEDESRDGA